MPVRLAAADLPIDRSCLQLMNRALELRSALVVALAFMLATVAPSSIVAQHVDAPPATIIRVIDGDTLDIAFVDGHVERTRLIGIDTPETKHPSKPVQCYGPEATARTTELALGTAAEVELDVQQGDRYGRLLAYVYIDGQMLNFQLAAEGYALPLTIPTNVKYAEQFVAAAASAREQNLGLWPACEGREQIVDIEPTTEDVAEQPGASEDAAEPAPTNCDPSDPDVCIPSPPPDLDCKDIPFMRFRVVGADPHRFDGDKDGIGCES
jgi:micrococcal nuclease